MVARDVRRFVAELEHQGLTAQLAKSGHYKVTTADGRFVMTVPNSPSDWRALKNARTCMRRRLAEMRHGRNEAP